MQLFFPGFFRQISSNISRFSHKPSFFSLLKHRAFYMIKLRSKRREMQMKKSMDKLMKFLMAGLFVVAGAAVNSTCFFKLYQEEFDDDLLDELRKY